MLVVFYISMALGMQIYFWCSQIVTNENREIENTSAPNKIFDADETQENTPKCHNGTILKQ